MPVHPGALPLALPYFHRLTGRRAAQVSTRGAPATKIGRIQVTRTPMADSPETGKYAHCPPPQTHRRLVEAHILWHQSLEKYHESDAFLANLNATIEALRNVTFVLQKERSVPDFDAWY